MEAKCETKKVGQWERKRDYEAEQRKIILKNLAHFIFPKDTNSQRARLGGGSDLHQHTFNFQNHLKNFLLNN